MTEQPVIQSVALSATRGRAMYSVIQLSPDKPVHVSEISTTDGKTYQYQDQVQSAAIKAKIEKHAQAILALVYEAGLGIIGVDKIEADRDARRQRKAARTTA